MWADCPRRLCAKIIKEVMLLQDTGGGPKATCAPATLRSGTNPLAPSSSEPDHFRGLDGRKGKEGRRGVVQLCWVLFVDCVGRAGKTRRIRVAGAQAWGDVILDGGLGSSHVITW